MARFLNYLTEWNYGFWFLTASLIGYMITFSFVRTGKKYVKVGASNEFRTTSSGFTGIIVAAVVVPVLFVALQFFFTPWSEKYWRFTPGILFLVATVFDAWAIAITGRRIRKHLGYVIAPFIVAIIFFVIFVLLA